MLPWRMRWRSACGDMSISSTSSASSITASGTRSRTWTPVMLSTMSARLSRCWMLTVLMTVMPALEQILDVLPALLMLRAWRVGVRQLVDQRDVRAARG